MAQKKKSHSNKSTTYRPNHLLITLLVLLVASTAFLITVLQKTASPATMDLLQLSTTFDPTDPTPPPPSPTPLPTSTPTPPLPSPIVNQAPLIQTTILPTGAANTPYSTPVIAIDPDSKTIDSRVAITVSGLPSGLNFGYCTSTYSYPTSKTSCTISGQTNVSGKFNVTIKATDYMGATSSKTLILTILKKNTIIRLDPQPSPVTE